jgi:hypothetical protein
MPLYQQDRQAIFKLMFMHPFTQAFSKGASGRKK